MSAMSHRFLALVVPACLIATLAPAAPAGADGTTNVSLTSFGDIVVDNAHAHVFVSDPAASAVRVANLDGVLTTSLPNLYGARGMTLSDDASKLYVALSTGDAIAAVDTTTLAVTTIPTGASTCPTDVATTLGRLWFSYTCDGQWGSIGSVNPATGTVTPSLVSSIYGPKLEASPALPGTVLALPMGLSPTTLYAYTATIDPTPALTQRASTEVGGNGSDLAITADGTKVITASGSPYYHPAYLTSNLSGAGTYPTSNYPNAVATRADGMVAGGINGIYSPDVYLFSSGTTTLLRSYDFDGMATDYLVAGGMAFGTTKLYAVTSDVYRDVFRLNVITPQPKATVGISVDKTSYKYGATASVSATLSANATDRTVSIYATPYGGTKRLVKSGTVPVGGKLTVGVKVDRRTTFSVEHGATFARESAEKTIAVAAKLTAKPVRYLRKSGKYFIYKLSKAFTVGQLTPGSYACLTFRAQFYVHGTWGGTLKSPCLSTDARGKASAVLVVNKATAGVPVRIRTEFAGNTQNAKAVSAWQFLKFVS